MKKIDYWIIFALGCAFMVAACFLYPHVFSDRNEFLKGFVGPAFLSFMGLIVTITLASTANIHIELKKIEKEAGKEFLHKTKKAVRRSAHSLIIILGLSVVLVVAKPILPMLELFSAFANCFALWLILWGLMVIYDITRLAFKL